MSVSEGPTPGRNAIKDPEFKQHLQRLRRADNVTNWYYIARAYLFLAAVIGGTIAFYNLRADYGLPVWTNVPVTVLAILLVGAGQHQLAGLAHEAVHQTLFRNRLLNELASDWLCSLPIFSSTFHYGLHHLAHHQFVNDPDRDPDLSQMETSGHHLRFPMSRADFLKTLLKQLWIPNLVKYSRARAEYDSLGTENNPYVRRDWTPSRLPSRLGVVHLLVLTGLLWALVRSGNTLLLVTLPLILWAVILTVFALLPERFYYQSLIRPVLSVRARVLMRISFLTVLLWALAWGTSWAGPQVLLGFGLLWLTPLFTSFAFYNVLRQTVQHGNADRGWLTNTRVFRVNPLIDFAVFPIGQNYHLPHHMFATVPHYRLPELHRLLMNDPDYRREATVVEGYLWAKRPPPRNPTVAEVLGPDHAPRESREIYIDHTVLEQNAVDENDRAELLGEAGSSSRSPRRWDEGPAATVPMDSNVERRHGSMPMSQND